VLIGALLDYYSVVYYARRYGGDYAYCFMLDANMPLDAGESDDDVYYR